jgi:hypothetical protein
VTANSVINEIRLFDISSRLCFLDFTNNRTAVLDVSSLSKGIYIVEVITEKEIFKQKLIVE